MVEQKEYIMGSTGGNDYLVVTRTDNLIIGIKAVLEPVVKDDKPGLLIGIRIRAVPIPGSNILNTGHVAQTTFPGFTWQKTEKPKYASSFLGSITNPFPESLTWEKFAETLASSKFIASMTKMLQPLRDVAPFLYTIEELNHEIEQAYYEVFSGEDGPQTKKPIGTIIPFPSMMPQ